MKKLITGILVITLLLAGCSMFTGRGYKYSLDTGKETYQADSITMIGGQVKIYRDGELTEPEKYKKVRVYINDEDGNIDLYVYDRKVKFEELLYESKISHITIINEVVEVYYIKKNVMLCFEFNYEWDGYLIK